MLGHLFDGLTATVGSPQSIMYLLAGVLLGVIVGVIPGLSGVVVISIALVFVYKLDLHATLIFFLGVHAAGTYSASISSILLNTPAHAEAVPVALDGYPMSQQGHGARALGISAASTAVSGIVGGFLLVLSFYIANSLATAIHAADMVAIIILAMFLVATLGVKRTSKALISIGLGFLIASIGTSYITGETRFDFGSIYLMSGVSLAVIAIAMFAVPQMAELFATSSSVTKGQKRLKKLTGSDDAATHVDEAAFSMGETLRGAREALRYRVILLRSSVIGFIGGIIPGVGGFATNYVSYGLSKQLSRKRGHLYGTGIPEGIVAAEGSSLAKEEGSKVMTLGLGIPTGTASALFLVALAIQGVKPGIGFITNYPVEAYQVVWVFVICTLLGTGLGVLAGPMLARVTKVPGTLLFPFVISFCLVGVYVADVDYFTLGEVIVFGVLGLLLHRLGYSLAAFMMGVVLGPILEQNAYITKTLHPGTSVITARPSALIILLLALVVLVVKMREVRREKRKTDADNPKISAIRNPIRKAGMRDHEYPILELGVTTFFFIVAILGGWYALANYEAATSALPVMCCVLTVLGTAWQLPGDVSAVVELYRDRRQAKTLAADATGAGVASVDRVGDAPAMTIAAPASAGPGAVLTLEHAAATDVLATTVSGADKIAPIVRRAWGWHGQYTREAVAFLWVIAAAVMGWAFGFRVGITVFVVAFGLTATRRALHTLRSKVLYAAIGGVIFYVLVSVLFQSLNLYETPLFNIPYLTY